MSAAVVPVAAAAADEAEAVGTISLSPEVGVAERLDLPGGAMALRTFGGNVLIGPMGTEIVLLDGSVGVLAPEPLSGVADLSTGWNDGTLNRFLDMVLDGASLTAAAEAVEPYRLAAASPTNELDTTENATCIAAEDARAQAKQCVRRQTGHNNGTHRFVGAASHTWAAPGDDQEFVSIRKIKNKHDYGKTEVQEIVDWEPKVDQEIGSCGQVSTGVSGFGISVSYNQTLCPDRLLPKLRFLGQEQFRTEWQGNRRGPAVAQAADIVKVPSPAPSKLLFSFEVEYKRDCPFSNPTVCEWLVG